MSDMETTVIPLDDAREVLGKFGIGPEGQAYQRWRRDDGFRRVDLESVLSKSVLVLAIDWRESLLDALENVATQLYSLGFSFDSDLDDDGNQGYVEIDGKRGDVKYDPSDNDDLDDVMRSINQLIKEKAQYRKFRSCEGTDSRWYGLLSNENWKSLESNLPGVLSLIWTVLPGRLVG